MEAADPSLPVLVDARALVRRLAHEEQALQRALARLEERVRRFEDVEHPAYEAWLRLELGPLFADLAERAETWRARDLFVARIEELIDAHGMDPREALHVVTAAFAGAPRPDGPRRREELEAERREEIAARRRAKIEARRRAKRARKREEREEARRARMAARSETAAPAADPARRRLIELYRALARRLHPDSPSAIGFRDPVRGRAVWMEVQAAYGARSLERLLAISAWLEDGVGGEGEDPAPNSRPDSLLSLAERHDRLRALGRSCRALERRLEALAREPAWEFPTASGGVRRTLRQAAARRLEAERAEMDDALALLDGFVASIGSPRPPRAAGKRRR
jgi:hypothetical protein